jgi:dTDP-4-amino-4,6-dideoxy-D-glucose acyltransferase
MFGYYSEEELSQLGFGSLGKNVMLSRAVEFVNVSRIFIGNNSRIDTFAIIAPSGDAIFKIGSFVHICAYTIPNGLASITLHDFTTIGLHCSILSSSDNFSGEYLTNATIDKKYRGTISAPIVLKKHAIIATGVTILPGVNIEEGTVVGAHSLVKESTEPFTIVAGVPAKIVKNRNSHLLDLEKIFLKQIQAKKPDHTSN